MYTACLGLNQCVMLLTHTHIYIYIEREINNYVCVCVQDWSEVGEFIYKKSTFSFQLRGLVADRFGHINHSTMMLQHIER